MIADFVDGKRFMTRYHAGHKKEKKARPALSNHTEGC
jgi:hypothetical protein